MAQLPILQINANWCLPYTSNLIKYGVWEKSITTSIFVLIGVLFFYGMRKNIQIAATSSKRIDILKNRLTYRFVKWKYFSFFTRLLPALLFVFIIITGIYGRKYTSLAAGFTWIFWWTVLIFFVAFLGNVFCAICPWDFFANLLQFNWFHKTKNKKIGLGLKWPNYLKNVYPAIIFFILFTWLELGFDITRNSYLTAVLGLGMLGMAMLFAIIFDKRVFCRYICLVGRVSGIYSQVSPFELRKADNDICKSCKTKECITGTETTTECPTFEKPFLLNENTNCTLCTECIRSCQKDNLTIMLRPIATDLSNTPPPKNDETLLTYLLLILTFFHGITMTRYWFSWTAYLSDTLNINYLGSFTILMLIVIIASYSILSLIDILIKKTLKGSYFELSLSYALIPITLAYHLAHNCMHLLVESAYLIPNFNDPMGYGWDLLGLADYSPVAFITPDTLRYIQIVIVIIGFFYSIKILRNRLQKITKNYKSRITTYCIYYILLVSLSLLSIWFIYEPMIMKSTGI